MVRDNIALPQPTAKHPYWRRYDQGRKLGAFRGVTARLHLAAAMAGVLVVAACSDVSPLAVDPDVDDTFQVPSTVTDGDTYVVSRDNPVIAGTARLVNWQGERVDGGFEVCCERLTLDADEKVFPEDHLPLSAGKFTFVDAGGGIVGDSRETGQEDVLVLWEAPTVLLPADRSEVSLTFARGTFAQPPQASQTITVRLSNETLVLPVHVHWFITPGRTTPYRRLVRRMMQAQFDPPGKLISATTVNDRDTGRSKTIIRTERARTVNRPPDEVWARAGIQFRLASFELVEDRDLARWLLNDEENALPYDRACKGAWTRVGDFHTRNGHGSDGIHVYVGGGIRPLDTGFTPVPGAACGAYNGACRERVIEDDKVWLDATRYGDKDHTLAHELGHILGLAHSWDGGACGRALVGDADQATNLMGGGFELTEAQIGRARSVACNAARLYGTKPASWC